jgi:hypothetical protein
MKIHIPLVVLLLSMAGACDVINPAEKVPAYLELNHFSVQSNYTTQGSNSHKIRDAWVYVDNEYIGTYELPAQFPVLADGIHRLTIGAGILDNGIASTRVAYPFYRFYEADVTFRAGEIFKIDTVPVSYFPALSYTWFEDFEGSGYSLDTTSSSLANLAVETTQVFEGSKSIKMEVTSSANVLECATVNAYQIPVGSECYLEINYKCDQAFVMGIIANIPGSTVKVGVISFNPSPDWNKTYVNLKKTIGTYGTAFDYNVYFRLDLADGASQGTVYMDNLKLIHN